MAWKLIYHSRAVKQIKNLNPKDQSRVIDKVKQLVKDPQDPALNIKPLIDTQQSFRLRVGKIRVLFEKESKSRIIYIWRVKFRGSVY